jgi:hypothetical protein
MVSGGFIADSVQGVLHSVGDYPYRCLAFLRRILWQPLQLYLRFSLRREFTCLVGEHPCRAGPQAWRGC